MPDEQPRTTRAETRRKHRQDLIVAATEAELERAGIHGTTLEQVGERVGLSRAALYYYVDSRDDLLTLVLDDVFQQQIAESDHIAGCSNSRSQKAITSPAPMPPRSNGCGPSSTAASALSSNAPPDA